MIEHENLDVRTITLGISLLDCIDSNLDKLNQKVYEKITTVAKDLVVTGDQIEQEYGIPIVNKRISVTPISLIGGSACKKPEDFVEIAKTLDRAAKEVGVNFIGGYSALVSKAMTKSDELLIHSVPQALACTDRVCSSINVGSTKTGINMDAVRLCGEIVKETAEATKDNDSLGCAKLVIFCNAPDDMEPPAGSKTVEELGEIAKIAGIPFIVKGVMTVRGALKAKEAGASAIVVSNHGGRVLDQCPATAEVLEEIARAVGDSMKIFVDGGIRSGVDVFKALALGADAVIIARPFVTAVYGGAEEGVKSYIDKIGTELEDTMKMCGVTSLKEITRASVWMK